MTSRYLLQRVYQAAFVIVVVTVIAFVLLRAAPGDPALLMLPPEAGPKLVAQVRASMGLDRPLIVQFWAYTAQLIHGNLGWSERFHVPVTQVIAEFFPRTLQLASTAMLVSSTIGISLGVLAAMNARSLADVAVTSIAVIGQSVPGFWLGIMLIVVFAVKLGWLPASGGGGLGLILPVVTLSMYLMAMIVRVTRSIMIEVLSQDYVRTAVAKGLPPSRVIVGHALRNGFLLILTVVGLQLGNVVGGAAITEAVFAWPGLGTVAFQAIGWRDYALVQGVVLFSAVSFVFINVAIDLLYTVLDPRIRYG
jgi:peptide/nickel transport system permease protein